MPDNTQGDLVLPTYAKASLESAGINPDKWIANVNAYDKRGGTDRIKALQGYYSLIDKTRPEPQQSLRKFVYEAERTPMNEVTASWWDDMSSGVANSLDKLSYDVDLAWQSAKRGVGALDENEFEQKIQDINLAKEFTQFKLSPAANKDILDNPNSFAAAIGQGLGQGLTTIVPIIAGTLTGQPEIAALGFLTAGSSGTVTAYGSVFETAKANGLNNEQAASLAAPLSLMIGAVEILPEKVLSKQMTKTFVKDAVEESVKSFIKKGMTKEALNATVEQAGKGILPLLKQAGVNYAKYGAKQGSIEAVEEFSQGYIETAGYKLYDNMYGKSNFSEYDLKSRDEFVKNLKAGLVGGVVGGLLSAPAMLKSNLQKSMYGFVDENADNPQAIEGLKKYVVETALANGKTEEEAQGIVTDIDDIVTVSSQFKGVLPDADSRFQVFNIIKDKRRLGQEIAAADAKIAEWQQHPEQSFAQPIIEQFTALKNELAKKVEVSNSWMNKLGTDKKKIDWKEYEKAFTANNTEIQNILAQIEGKPVEEGVVEEAAQPTADVEQITAEATPQKEVVTVRDLINVPTSIAGKQGTIDENGNFVTETPNDTEAQFDLDADAEEIGFTFNNQIVDESKKRNLEPKIEEDAIQIESTDESVLRTEESQVGLQGVEQGNSQQEIITEQGETEQTDEGTLGAEITPNKKVSVAQNKAIKDVTDNLNTDLKDMEAAMLYSKFKDESVEGVDIIEGLTGKTLENLEKKDYLEYDNDKGYMLTDKGKEFIGRVKARIETRRGVKAGTDMFPQLANIPELQELKTLTEELLPATKDELIQYPLEQVIEQREVQDDVMKREYDEAIGIKQQALKDIQDETADIENGIEANDTEAIEEAESINEFTTALADNGIVGEQGQDLRPDESVVAEQQPEDIESAVGQGIENISEQPSMEAEARPEPKQTIQEREAGERESELGATIKFTHAGAPTIGTIVDKRGNKYDVIEADGTKYTVKELDVISITPKNISNEKAETPKETEASVLTDENGKNAKVARSKSVRATKATKEEKINRQQRISKARTINASETNIITKVIQKAFPKVKINFLNNEQFKEKFGNESLGVIGEDGQAYINTDKITTETLVHEMGHIWTSWAKRYAPMIYQHGLTLASQDADLIMSVQQLYPDLKGDALYEEALATMIGEQGGIRVERLLNANDSYLKQLGLFFQNLWNKLTGFVRKFTDIKEDNPFNIHGTENFSEFTALVADALLSNGQVSIKDFSSTEVADIEGAGQRFMMAQPSSYGDEYIEKVAGLGTVTMPSYNKYAPVDELHANIQNKMMSAWTAAQTEAGEEPITAREIKAIGKNTLRGELIKLVTDVQSKTGADKLLKTFALELRESLEKAGKDEFVDDLYNWAIGDGSIDNAQRKETRVWLGDFGKFVAQRKHLGVKEDNLLADNYSMIPIEEAVIQGQKEISAWRSKFDKYKQNKYLKPIVEGLESFLRITAHGGTFIKLMAGNSKGIIHQLGRGMFEAEGKNARYRNNAQNNLEALKKKLLAGSQTYNPNMKLKDLEGVNVREFFGDDTLPDIKVTTEELFTMFGFMQSKDIGDVFFLKDDKGQQSKMNVPEFGDERKTTILTLKPDAKEKLIDHFRSMLPLISDTWVNSSDYIYEEVNKVYKAMNGIDLGKTEPDENGLNFYFTKITTKDYETADNFNSKPRELDDISSHKRRESELGLTYLVVPAFQVMNKFIDTNARYASHTIPVYNMDKFMDANEKFFSENGMLEYVNWWRKTKEHFLNPPKQGALEKKLLSGFVVSRLGLNPFVDLKQFSSIPLVTSVIRSKYLIQAQSTLWEVLGKEIKNYDIFSGDNKVLIDKLEEMKTHNDYALLRITQSISEFEKLLETGGFRNIKIPIGGKVYTFDIKSSDALKNIKSIDTATGAMIWDAAKLQVEGEYAYLPKDSKEYWDKVGEIYERAVVGAQSSVDEWNRAFFAKQDSMIARALSLFAGQGFSNFNLFVDSMINYMDNPTPKNKLLLAKTMMTVFVTSALMVATVDALRYGLIGAGRDEPEDVYMKYLLKASYQNVPIVSPLLDLVVQKTDNRVWSRDLTYPVYEIINSGATAIASLPAGDFDKAMKEGMEFGAGYLGIPMTPIRIGQKVLQD